MTMKTRLDEIRERFQKAAMSPGEKLADDLEKRAGIGSRLVTIGAGAVSIPAATIGAQYIHDEFYRKKADKRYNYTVSRFPELKRHKPAVIREHFEVLKNMAPRMAATPLIAGPWLMRTMQFSEEGLAPTQLRDVMELEEAKTTPGRLPEVTGTATGKMIARIAE